MSCARRPTTGLAQEIYALLSTYQILRIAMADATLSTNIDPDRASFTVALPAALEAAGSTP